MVEREVLGLRDSVSEMPEKHTVRTVFIITTAATLLGTLLVPPVQDFVGAAWRVAKVIAVGIWHVFTAPVSVWVLLVAVGIVALLVWRAAQRASPVESAPRSIERPSPPRVVVPRELDRFQKQVMRAMADEDGGTPTVDELADNLGTSRLRVDQALEQLEAFGYIRMIRDVVNGPVVEVTRAGRDYLIGKGWV
jgi:hypothetical protein